MNKIIFTPFSKFDDDQHIVAGYASTEAIDSDDEIILKEAVAEALDDYMKFANIRQMHQPSVVGLTRTAEMREKGLYIEVEIFDMDAWDKIKNGLYKGFSIGGKFLKKVGNIISKLEIYEISVVDRPANPEALFTLFKLSGDKPVTISKSDVSKAQSELSNAYLQKGLGLGNVADLSCLLQNLEWITSDSEWEKQYEGDDSAVPTMLRQAYNLLSEALKSMVVEETDEAQEDLDTVAAAGADETVLTDVNVELAAKNTVSKADNTASSDKEDIGADPSKDDTTQKSDENTAPPVSDAPDQNQNPVVLSDEQKQALSVVYQLMKDSGLLEEFTTKDAETPNDDGSALSDAENENNNANVEDGDDGANDGKEQEQAVDDNSNDNNNENVDKSAEEMDEEDLSNSEKSILSIVQKSVGKDNKQVVKALLNHISELEEQLEKTVVSKGSLFDLYEVGRDGKVEKFTHEQAIEKGMTREDRLKAIFTGKMATR